jgi:hypothetical protein
MGRVAVAEQDDHGTPDGGGDVRGPGIVADENRRAREDRRRQRQRGLTCRDHYRSAKLLDELIGQIDFAFAPDHQELRIEITPQPPRYFNESLKRPNL